MDSSVSMNTGIRAKEKKQSVIGKLPNYQSLFWVFMIGSLLGFLIEGIWMIIRYGYWESHTATIWGPFCIIYGIGAVAVYAISHLLIEKNIIVQFAAFFLSGGAVEYFSSLFQERCFGSVSWDYSEHFLNLGGRVSLKMALTWGVLGILFMRFLFPLLTNLFSKLRGKHFNIACGIMTVFMIANLGCTSVALMRWSERLSDIPTSNRIEQFVDSVYDNEKMEKNFPNMDFQGK